MLRSSWRSSPQWTRTYRQIRSRYFANKPELTHVDAAGKASMVDVGSKPSTRRQATALGRLQFSEPGIATLVASNSLKKGDVLAVARVAGIMAAKNTSQLIPLCHPLAISKIKNDVEVDENLNCVLVSTTVECVGPTGVEMEALVGATTTLNTVYDMCKAVDRHMELQSIKVVRKQGGRHDFDTTT